MFVVLLFHITKWIVEPYIILRINTDPDYNCSDTIKVYLSLRYDVDFLIWPLCCQAVFLGLMWQLGRIQQEEEERPIAGSEYYLNDLSSIRFGTL